MAKRIEKLTLCHFRGATCEVEIDFDSSKRITLIFGENGTGKSTIVDAIDFVCNESIGSLGEKSSTSPAKDHLPALGQTAKEIKAEVVCDGKTWKGTFAPRGPITRGDADRPRARILRRSQILKVIEAEPYKRYEELKTFIAVPGIERSENALRDASNKAKQDFEQAIRDQGQAEEQLQQYWQAEGSPDKDSLSWAASKSAENISELKATLSIATEVFEAMKSCNTLLTSLRGAETAYAISKTAREEAEANLKKAEESEGEGGSELLAILQDTRTFLDNNHPSHCPVCEKDIEDVEALKKRIRDRLTTMATLSKLKEERDVAVQMEERSSSTVFHARQHFFFEVRGLATKIKTSPLLEVTVLINDWSKYPAIFNQTADDNPVIQAKAFLLEAVEHETPFTAKKEELNKAVYQFNAIKNHHTTIIEKTTVIEELALLSTRLKKTLEIVEKKRKDYVESILVKISGSVDDLYQRVHPNEDLGKIRFYLDPRPSHKGSLKFDGDFHSKSDVPPQAYYSESHLDTLGICVFVALAKYFKDEQPLVVLDDVLTSADSVHMDRLIQLLHDEADNFHQLIITTHYRPWFDRYRYPHSSTTGKIQLIQLLHWSIPRGIRHSRTRLSVEDLQELLKKEPLERQAVASKAGILLEGVLDHLTLLYGCNIPRKAVPSYTLAELMRALNPKLRNVLKIRKTIGAGTAETEIKPLIERLESTAWIRNQIGCHFSAGSDITDREVKEFAEHTIALADAIVCHGCGEVSRRSKDGSSWDCKCGETKLYPLIIPGTMVPSAGAIE